jgi:opacity protein-like surface antigen
MRPGINIGLCSVPVLLGLILGASPARLWPSESERTPGYAVSVEAGMFRANQASFRTLYGGGPLVFSVHLRARIAAGLWAVAGWKTLNVEGTTAIAGPSFDDESYRLEFEMTSLRFGLRYAHEIGRFAVFAGAGGSSNQYEERWTDVAGLGGSGKNLGWYAELGGEYAAARFLTVFLRGEYSSIPTGRGSALDPDVDLGGLEAAAGLAFRF